MRPFVLLSEEYFKLFLKNINLYSPLLAQEDRDGFFSKGTEWKWSKDWNYIN